jgi:hypothetical protein
MSFVRPVPAVDPRRFGRGRVPAIAAAPPIASLNGDLKLFAATFAAGFLVASILIA